MNLLFVCVHNAGRSVMAEAFATALGGGRVTARSAGTDAGSAPHAVVVEAMAEVGIDVSAHRAILLTDQMVAEADRVITMGCAVDDDACPSLRLSTLEDWGLPDPKGLPIEQVRSIRDQVRARVLILLEQIGADAV